jgi:hypothetical protein
MRAIISGDSVAETGSIIEGIAKSNATNTPRVAAPVMRANTAFFPFKLDWTVLCRAFVPT